MPIDKTLGPASSGSFTDDAVAATLVRTANSGTALEGTLAPAPTVSSPRISALPQVSVPPSPVMTVLPAPTATVAEPYVSTRPRFEKIKTLGEGTYGEVLLMMDHDIDRPVAVKRMRMELLRDDTLARFAEEVRVVGRMEHPGIAPVHDVGMDEQGYFFVMKYVEGETLEAIIERIKKKDPATLKRFTMEARTHIMIQVLRAMEFAHARGVLHRDIKPANIMVGPSDEALVLDWGIAGRAGAQAFQRGEPAQAPARMTGTDNTWWVGTPMYMSPEQARRANDEVDVRSDVYGLAATFYEFFTGAHYLTPKTTTEAVLKAVSDEEPMNGVAIHHTYGVPPEVAYIIRRSLNKDPAKRHQTVCEMRIELVAASENSMAVVCPCTGLKRAGGVYGDFIDNHPIAAVTVAVLTASMALYGVAALVGNVVHAVSG